MGSLTPLTLAPHATEAAGALAPVMNLLALAAVALALLLIASRRLNLVIILLGAQSIVLGAMAGLVALASVSLHIGIAAALAILVKGLLVPRILFLVLDRIRVRREIEPVVPGKVALVLAAGLIVLAYWVTRPLRLPTITGAEHALPAAVALMLLGGLVMVTRRKAISQIAGLMVMENGLYLAAMVVTAGMPLMVELGVFFDVLIGVLVMGIIAFRINQTFDTINVDRLRRLKY
jgi:hydrogenase-4 component E